MKNNPKLAIVLFALSLVAFILKIFLKDNIYFMIGVALMVCGVALTPRNKKK